MKKIYFLGMALLSGMMSVNAQSSLIVTHDGNVIANGAVITRTTATSVEDIYDINVKNSSGATKSYKFRRYDDVVNTNADPYFCVQQCYTPATMISPTALTLNAGQDAHAISVNPSLHLMENGAPGLSEIRYRIYDENNSSDEFVLIIRYNGPVGIKSNSAVFAGVSDVYPNPSSSKAFINVSSPVDNNNVKMTLMNTLGAIVSTKQLELNAGKNTVAIDVDAVTSGVYLMTLSSGNAVITRKITVSK